LRKAANVFQPFIRGMVRSHSTHPISPRCCRNSSTASARSPR
jgi:hypothetical protein